MNAIVCGRSENEGSTPGTPGMIGSSPEAVVTSSCPFRDMERAARLSAVSTYLKINPRQFIERKSGARERDNKKQQQQQQQHQPHQQQQQHHQ